MGLKRPPMITKMNKAMIILYKEQQRRAKLPIRNNAYINEIKFMRKFLRRLYRKLALFKPKAGKYPVLLTEEQIDEIEDFYEVKINVSDVTFPGYLRKNINQDYENFKSQIRTLKGDSDEPILHYEKIADRLKALAASGYKMDQANQATKDISGNRK